jgi:hypothetical protein
LSHGRPGGPRALSHGRSGGTKALLSRSGWIMLGHGCPRALNERPGFIWPVSCTLQLHALHGVEELVNQLFIMSIFCRLRVEAWQACLQQFQEECTTRVMKRRNTMWGRGSPSPSLLQSTPCLIVTWGVGSAWGWPRSASSPSAGLVVTSFGLFLAACHASLAFLHSCS